MSGFNGIPRAGCHKLSHLPWLVVSKALILVLQCMVVRPFQGLKDIFSRFFNKEVMLMLTLTPTTSSATPKSQNLEAPLGCRNSRNTRFISGSN